MRALEHCNKKRGNALKLLIPSFFAHNPLRKRKRVAIALAEALVTAAYRKPTDKTRPGHGKTYRFPQALEASGRNLAPSLSSLLSWRRFPLSCCCQAAFFSPVTVSRMNWASLLPRGFRPLFPCSPPERSFRLFTSTRQEKQPLAGLDFPKLGQRLHHF